MKFSCKKFQCELSFAQRARCKFLIVNERKSFFRQLMNVTFNDKEDMLHERLFDVTELKELPQPFLYTTVRIETGSWLYTRWSFFIRFVLFENCWRYISRVSMLWGSLIIFRWWKAALQADLWFDRWYLNCVTAMSVFKYYCEMTTLNVAVHWPSYDEKKRFVIDDDSRLMVKRMLNDFWWSLSIAQRNWHFKVSKSQSAKENQVEQFWKEVDVKNCFNLSSILLFYDLILMRRLFHNRQTCAKLIVSSSCQSI